MRTAILFLLLAITTSCGGNSNSTVSSNSLEAITFSDNLIVKNERTQITSGNYFLSVEASVPSDNYLYRYDGDNLKLVYKATNIGNDTIEKTFSDTCLFQWNLIDNNGTAIRGNSCGAAIVHRTFSPNQTDSSTVLINFSGLKKPNSGTIDLYTSQSIFALSNEKILYNFGVYSD